MRNDRGPGPYADFGQWLRERREARGRAASQSNLAGRATGDTAVVTQGKLSHLERGWNQDPEPALLRAVATLYQVPYAEIVGRWMEARFGVRVKRGQEGSTEATLHETGADRLTADAARLESSPGGGILTEGAVELAAVVALRALERQRPTEAEAWANLLMLRKHALEEDSTRDVSGLHPAVGPDESGHARPRRRRHS